MAGTPCLGAAERRKALEALALPAGRAAAARLAARSGEGFGGRDDTERPWRRAFVRNGADRVKTGIAPGTALDPSGAAG